MDLLFFSRTLQCVIICLLSNVMFGLVFLAVYTNIQHWWWLVGWRGNQNGGGKSTMWKKKKTKRLNWINKVLCLLISLLPLPFRLPSPCRLLWECKERVWEGSNSVQVELRWVKVWPQLLQIWKLQNGWERYNFNQIHFICNFIYVSVGITAFFLLNVHRVKVS